MKIKHLGLLFPLISIWGFVIERCGDRRCCSISSADGNRVARATDYATHHTRLQGRSVNVTGHLYLRANQRTLVSEYHLNLSPQFLVGGWCVQRTGSSLGKSEAIHQYHVLNVARFGCERVTTQRDVLEDGFVTGLTIHRVRRSFLLRDSGCVSHDVVQRIRRCTLTTIRIRS